MNELPIVSIIIVNYNGKKYLKDCFESLEKMSYPKDKYEVIMVDNSSSDDSVEYTRKFFPWIKILKLDKNYWFCKANNEGAKIACGKYIVFLNNDTYVTKNWLENLVKGVTSNEKIISAGCKMLKPYKINGMDMIDYAGGKISPDGSGIYVGIFDTDKEKYNNEEYTGFGCGAGVIIDRKFFINTGGFDEYYFATTEEIDLGLRVWRYGYKVLYIPSSLMYHKRIGTYSGYITPDLFATNVKNTFYFILKNFEIQTIFVFLFWALFFYFIKIIYFFIKGEQNISIAIIKEILSFLKNIKYGNINKRIIKERKKINQNKKVSDKELYKYGIISSVIEKVIYNKNFLNGIKITKNK